MAGIVRGSVGGACINNFTFFFVIGLTQLTEEMLRPLYLFSPSFVLLPSHTSPSVVLGLSPFLYFLFLQMYVFGALTTPYCTLLAYFVRSCCVLGDPENPILRTMKKKKKYRNTLYCVVVAYLVFFISGAPVLSFLDDWSTSI